MVRELPFAEYKRQIEDFRLNAYAGALSRGSDEYDAIAHHFALFDDHDQMQGLARVLRSDEVPQFELANESRMQKEAIPTKGLGLELSRACTRDGSAGVHMFCLCKEIEKYAIEQKADYLIAKTEGFLLPIYLHFGFEVFAEPFKSDFFDDNRTVFPIIYRWNHPAPVETDDLAMVW